jgi:hypothetical protein
MSQVGRKSAQSLPSTFPLALEYRWRPLVSIYIAHPSSRTDSSESLTFVSAPCFDALTRNPFIEFGFEEPHPGSRKLYEGNATFLHEAPDEALGASEATRDSANV